MITTNSFFLDFQCFLFSVKSNTIRSKNKKTFQCMPRLPKTDNSLKMAGIHKILLTLCIWKCNKCIIASIESNKINTIQYATYSSDFCTIFLPCKRCNSVQISDLFQLWFIPHLSSRTPVQYPQPAILILFKKINLKQSEQSFLILSIIQF